MMPALVLKKMVMGNFDKRPVEKDIADSIDFMVESVWTPTLRYIMNGFLMVRLPIGPCNFRNYITGTVVPLLVATLNRGHPL